MEVGRFYCTTTDIFLKNLNLIKRIAYEYGRVYL